MAFDASRQTWPLTAFEHYMWADHRPSYPMHFFLKTVLSGSLDQERFSQAVRQATRIHPLLRSRIVGKREAPTAKLSWEVADETPDVVQYVDDLEQVGAAPPLDLRFETGLRVYVAPLPSSHHQVVWQAHHSCCDAIGLLAFVEDALKIYSGANAASPSEEHWQARQAAVTLSGRERLRRMPKDIQRASRFFVNAPFTVAKPKADKFEVLSEALLHGEEMHLSEAETDAVRDLAKKTTTTVNDVLLAGTFMVLADTAYQGPADAEACLRIAMPINMRRHKGRHPVANVVSMCFLDRKINELQTFRSLLQSIAQETRDIKQNDMGLTLHEVLKLLGTAPYGIHSLTGAKRCLASAVLSNLGAPSIDDGGGSLHLRRVTLFPPLRPFNYLSFGACTLDGRLALSLHYDHRHITRAEAKDLLADLKTYLLENAADIAEKKR